MDNILELFINNPYKEFYVREISKKLKISPTTISKYLKKMEKEGLLLSENKYNHLFFKAHNENLLFKQKKVHYNICMIINSGLIDYLNKILDAEIILMDNKDENYEITLLVISNKKIIKEINLNDFEKRLGKLNILFYSIKEIKNNKEIINRLINGIIIKGYLRLD